jgi:hypothetical protein
MSTVNVVARDEKVMVLRAVVIAHETGHVLEMLRFEIEDRRSTDALRLLASSDKRLAE